jgi:nucleotidyltransferase/DNA polymerase involved in DNA repair
MHSLGIHTGADLKQRSLTELTHHFGKAGHYYYKIARAEDDRLVEANRVRKSIGAETSFDSPFFVHDLLYGSNLMNYLDLKCQVQYLTNI